MRFWILGYIILGLVTSKISAHLGLIRITENKTYDKNSLWFCFMFWPIYALIFICELFSRILSFCIGKPRMNSLDERSANTDSKEMTHEEFWRSFNGSSDKNKN